MPTPVLLVDDDEFARSFVRTVLERAGYQVHEADDVASAISAAQSTRPRAVVTDWNLPDGNGGILARTLRADMSSLPVILITGEAADCEQSFEFGGSEFSAVLHKPFAPSVLEKAIDKAIRR